MPTFKDYYNNAIKIPDHKHQIIDTKRNNTTAYATTSDTGFITKEDMFKIDLLYLLAEGLEIDSKNLK